MKSILVLVALCFCGCIVMIFYRQKQNRKALELEERLSKEAMRRAVYASAQS